MDPFVGFLIVAIAVLQIAVIYLIHRERKSREMIKKQYQEISRRFFEVSLLNSIQDKIGYSLNTRTIAETIVTSVQELFQISSASFILIQDNEMIFKTYLREGVQEKFTLEVVRLLVQAIHGTDPNSIKYPVKRENKALLIESYTVLPSDTVPKSFFNIPLVLNNKLVGMINIASRLPNVYKEQDMSMLYKIVNQAEQAYERLQTVLNTEEAKIESMVASLPTGVLLFTFENNKLHLSYANAAAHDMLHLITDPTLEQALASFYPEVPILDHLKHSISDKKSIFIRDIKMRRKTLHMYINPIFIQENQRIVGVTIAIRNMTLEKEIEELKQTFTDMVVHELRAPLTSIKGAASLLISGKLGKEEQEKMMQLIADSSSRMMDDVGDLLDAAKIEEGRFQINPTMTDINALIREKVALFSFSLVSKHLETSFNLDKTIAPFLFDTARIGQVINNLISNSIKYTPSGGKIIISTTREGGNIRVSVQDTGIGIPQDKKALLFSKYGQVHRDVLFKGTGLGLYISKGIIDSHHGTISAISEGVGGTTFVFTLPFVTQPIASPNYLPAQKVIN